MILRSAVDASLGRLLLLFLEPPSDGVDVETDGVVI